jgi:hypothetical protein
MARVEKHLLAVFQRPDTKQFLRVMGANYRAGVNACHNCIYLHADCLDVVTGYCKSDDYCNEFSNVWIEAATADDSEAYLREAYEAFYKAYGRWPNDAVADPKKPAGIASPPARKLQLK